MQDHRRLTLLAGALALTLAGGCRPGGAAAPSDAAADRPATVDARPEIDAEARDAAQPPEVGDTPIVIDAVEPADANDANDANDVTVATDARDANDVTVATDASDAGAGGRDASDASADAGVVPPTWPQPAQAYCPLRSATAPATYANPFTLPDEWPMYGIGDPFIFKHLGIYYLYTSTRDGQVGVRCYSSPDLVRWTSRGLCSSDPVTRTAYAPEVRYWNGTFYMYTSPAGAGHIVLTSSSPTGPFVAATGNLGASIDGSVFVDDDGRWTFLRAGSTGIVAHPMPTPLSIGPGTVIGAAFLGGWTEGPCLIKRGAVYYLTYTGNHVLAKSYRINVAAGTAGPTTGLSAAGMGNPVVVSSEGDFTGLGHSTSFLGPDLDTYYVTYHNKAGDFGVGPYRRLDIDRLAWNGSKMLVLGPTHTPQAIPAMPVFCDDFAAAGLGAHWEVTGPGAVSVQDGAARIAARGGTAPTRILTRFATTAGYSAEFNVRLVTAGPGGQARYGIVVSSASAADEVAILLRPDTNQLETRVASAATGTLPPRLSSLPAGFDHQSWHPLRVETSVATLRIYVDDLLAQQLDLPPAGAGRIGYLAIDADARFGYVAYGNQVNGSATFDTPKPIPGRLQAVHYATGREGAGAGYHDTTSGNASGGYRRDDVDIRPIAGGSFVVTSTAAGEWLAYAVNVAAAGSHAVGIRYAAAAPASVRLRAGAGAVSDVVALPATGGNDAFRTFTIRGVALPAGFARLTLEIASGSPDLQALEIARTDAVPATAGDEFGGAFAPGWTYADGVWSAAGGVATAAGAAKRAFGPTGAGDYDVSVELRGTGGYDAGLLLRATNAGMGGIGDDPEAGTDFVQGYFVGLSPTGVVLGKQNYGWTQLARRAGTFPAGVWTRLRVSIRQDTIQVFIDGGAQAAPVIVYTDPDPFIVGRPGLRARTGPVDFRHFVVTAP